MTVGEGEGHRGEFENVVVSVRPSQAKNAPAAGLTMRMWQ